MSFSIGAIALVTLALSVSTDAWLFTAEPVNKVIENQSYAFTINVRSGLWRVCTIYEDGKCGLCHYYVCDVCM